MLITHDTQPQLAKTDTCLDIKGAFIFLYLRQKCLLSTSVFLFFNLIRSSIDHETLLKKKLESICWKEKLSLFCSWTDFPGSSRPRLHGLDPQLHVGLVRVRRHPEREIQEHRRVVKCVVKNLKDGGMLKKR